MHAAVWAIISLSPSRRHTPLLRLTRTLGGPATMSDVEPRDARLVFGLRVNQRAFKCCEEPDGLLFRCPSCGHIWGVCMECDNWTPNLSRPSEFMFFYNFLAKDSTRGRSCPNCEVNVLEGENWFLPGIVDRYMPLPIQVVEAGLSNCLNDEAA